MTAPGYGLNREYDDRLPQVRPLAFGKMYATGGEAAAVRSVLDPRRGRGRVAVLTRR